MNSLYSDDQQKLLIAQTGTAIEAGPYRYLLTRTWVSNKPTALFIMLNPSKANANIDDPTIRRCISFARAWDYGRLMVVNLYAWRATDPRELLTCTQELATGLDNDQHLEVALANASVVIAAWGANKAPGILARVNQVRQKVHESGHLLHCLGTTKNGHPRHPLYVPASQAVTVF